MKKWALSALAYFLIVVGIYYGYSALVDSPADSTGHANMGQHE